ncbi:Ig-like domain-containing protein [Sporosarcina obsidiansis]|uniref:Ig-like domain-containing protein n=1 Tax=Sporosarcina obsidiansis TaxID=2660748 RepID=UPI00129A10C9|nr:Ig-like domain-containing protein [Sporosarcina obsidiansis]
MKKLKVLVGLSILLLLIPVIPTQAAVKKTTVGVSSAFAERAGAVEIGIFISSDEKIAGGSLDIVYDADQLRIRDTDVKLTDTLSSYLSSGGSDAAGTVSLSFAKGTGSLVDGTVMNLSTYVETPGVGKEIALTLENVELYNEQGKKIDAQLVHGQIKPFKGKEDTYSNAVTGDKEWVITLSNPYNLATLNTHAISMKRGTVSVPVEVEAVGDTKFKVKPVGKYARGTYTMEITEQLRSANGAKLSQPVRFTFKVN